MLYRHGMSRLVDLSHDITKGMVTYPGLPVPRLGSVFTHEESRDRYADGTVFAIGTVELCTNTGTYLDTPFHRYPDGHDLSALPLDRCADLRAVVIHTGVDSGPIGPEALDDLDLDGAAVLFDTGWSRHWGTERYLRTSTRSSPTPRSTRWSRPASRWWGSTRSTSTRRSVANGRRTRSSSPQASRSSSTSPTSPTCPCRERGSRGAAEGRGLGTFTVRAFAVVPDRDESTRPAVCEVVVDCADPASLAAFWGEVLGGQARVRSADWATVRDPRPGGLLVGFQRVPEAKTVKNRVHIDVWSDDIPADTLRLVAAGAVASGDIVEDEVGAFQVLLDPEGNEFCLVT